MTRVLDLKNKVALVTGAGGGIGREISRSLAARGCHLALADVNAGGMSETAALIGSAVRVSQHKLDVADAVAVASFPAEVLKAHGAVDVLINNAGVGLGGDFAQVSETDFDWLLDINLHGLIRMSRAFLPVLKSRPVAQLVNVSSILGILASPGQSAYVTSKFAVRGFSESLRHELEDAGSNLGVTVIHPGGVKTAIADNAKVSGGMTAEEEAERRARGNKTLRMSPEIAGEIIVKGIERRKARVLVGSDAKLVSILERLMPVSHYRLLKHLT